MSVRVTGREQFCDPIVAEAFRRIEAKGWSWREVEQRTGHPRSTLQSWREGRSPSVSALQRVLKAVDAKLTVSEKLFTSPAGSDTIQG